MLAGRFRERQLYSKMVVCLDYSKDCNIIDKDGFKKAMLVA